MKEKIQETIEKNMFRLNDDMIIENLTRATEMLKNSMRHAAEKNDPIVAIAGVPGAILQWKKR